MLKRSLNISGRTKHGSLDMYRIPPEEKQNVLEVKKFEMFSEGTEVYAVKFSPSGTAIAAGTEGGVTRIWPLDESVLPMINYSDAAVTTLDWEPKSGKLLFCGGNDGKVKLWNITSNKIVGEITMPSPYKRIVHLKCGPPSLNIFAISSATDNFRQGGALTLWDINKLQCITKLKFDAAINSVAFNHNGSMLISADQEGYLRIFDTNRVKLISKWKAHPNGACGVSFASDETTIYSAGIKEKINCWSAHAVEKLVRSYNFAGIHPASFRSDIPFDSDGNYFLMATKENYGVLYDVEQSKPLQTVGSHGKPVVSVDWHPIQSGCITASLDHTVCLTYFNNPKGM